MNRAPDIGSAAAEWLIRVEAQTSPQIWDTFQEWLDTDPRHRAAFVRLRAAWTHVDLLKNLRPTDGRIDSDLLARAQLDPARLASRGLEPLEGRPAARGWKLEPRGLVSFRPNRLQWVTAASVLVVIGLITRLGPHRVDWQARETAIGARSQLVLTDGSGIELNTDTGMRARITNSRRDVELTRGEALFRVAHDTTRPFYVTAGATVIRDVGTEFSVRIRDHDHVDVLVTQGRIAVGARAAPLGAGDPTLQPSAQEVSAGETASIGPGTIVIAHLPSGEVTRKLAWTAGRLWFQGETLDEAVEEFNRYNERHLTITDPSLRLLRVGGVFSATDPESFVAALRHSFGVRVAFDASRSETRLFADQPSAGQPPD